METEPILDLEEGEIEEGEIENDVEITEEIYTPIERPVDGPVLAKPVLQEDHSDVEERSSESSSDSDDSQRGFGRKSSKQRKRPIQHVVKPAVSPPKRKNYNIWSSDAMAETLANTLVNCNVERRFDYSRDVESYDHTLAHVGHTKEVAKVLSGGAQVGVRYSNKRNHTGHHVDVKHRDGITKSRRNSKDGTFTARHLTPLTKTVQNSAEELARDIANKLMEEKEDVVLNVVNVLGKEKAIQLFEETRQLEKEGGLLIMNGTRRRTPGGIYFYLVKGSEGIQSEQVSRIFAECTSTYEKDKKAAAREARQAKALKRREALKKEDYPTLLSRAEAAILKLKQDSRNTTQPVEQQGEDDGEVTNPPPSPATDGKDNSSENDDDEEEDNVEKKESMDV